jgi:porin
MFGYLRVGVVNVVVFIGTVTLVGVAEAQEEEASFFRPWHYSGDLKEREALTGDWGGKRSNWQDKGITSQLTLVNTLQGVVDGGRDTGFENGGLGRLTLSLDFEKLGLWPGGFMLIRGESSYGHWINLDTGTFLGGDVTALFPVANENETTLTDFTFIQFLSERFAVLVGKMNTLDGDANEFAHGAGFDNFLNTAFALNPVTLRTTPYAGLGAGVLYLPNATTQLSLLVIDSEGDPSKSGFDTVFDEGTTLSAEARVATNFGGLPGRQTLGGTFSNKDVLLLDEVGRIAEFADIESPSRSTGRRLLLGSALRRRTDSLRDSLIALSILRNGLERNDDSWSLYYNFDQYLHVEDEDPNQGWGIFGRIGFADADTSPIEAFYSIGFGGRGIIPGRDDDTFGIGYYYSVSSDELPDVLEIGDSQGIELFYNFHATPWLQITADAQFLDSAFERVDDSVVLGLRTKIEF